MKEVEGVDLSNLVEEASNEILNERRVGLRSLIKSKLNELNQSVTKKAELEKQLAKANKDIERLTSWLEKVKAGDWTVLNLSEGKDRNDGKGGEDKTNE